MAFEALYSEGERLDLAEKQKMRDVPRAIFIWMFVDGELTGETYGTLWNAPVRDWKICRKARDNQRFIATPTAYFHPFNIKD